jgi:hypothetical protein
MKIKKEGEINMMNIPEKTSNAVKLEKGTMSRSLYHLEEWV